MSSSETCASIEIANVPGLLATDLSDSEGASDCGCRASKAGVRKATSPCSSAANGVGQNTTGVGESFSLGGTGDEEVSSRPADSESEATHEEKAARCEPADSWLFLEGSMSDRDLPVQGARLYNLAVQPVPLPSAGLKLLIFPVFWLISLGWHYLQRHAQLAWGVPGNPGEEVALQRSRHGEMQVVLNALCVIALSAYALAAYVFHQKILRMVLNPLFTPRTWMGHYAISTAMFGIAIASSFFLTENWVAAAAGLFMFFGYGVCGRVVQTTSSRCSQIGLGPSRATEDAGASFHVEGMNAESGQVRSCSVQAVLLGGDAGESAEGVKLRFATLRPETPILGDDAVVVEPSADGSGTCTYHMPCGRANIFRVDCLIVLACTFGARLPQFLIGGGGFNQCVGLVELLASLVYIPVGYTCFAIFGFRVGLANRCSMGVVLVLCLWPIINLVLGGKGCGTLTDLVRAEYLPQIWDSSATTLTFSRGFASCTESAFALGGETLLVASTTIAAWVHIMSNFSFLFGFISGMLRMQRVSKEDKVFVQ